MTQGKRHTAHQAVKDIAYRLHAADPACGARRGEFATAHGSVQTPAFMVVGTAGFVRCTTPSQVAETGTEVLLANTYHLSSAERLATVKRAGGLHRFMAWNGTILTDSGGFQVFSLPGREVSDEGVQFVYEEGGERLFLDPERSMAIQRDLGADIVMAFDECVAHDAPEAYVRQSVRRTTRWAARCRQAALQPHQFLFGIVQGGDFPKLRRQSAAEIAAIPFDGFAIGGVSVGEGHERMRAVVELTAPLLPVDRPRYLMGVGLPEDILAAVHAGIDMFDCVIPTRYARGGTLFTRTGKLRVMDRNFRKDRYPPDTACRCYTCRTYSRMLLRYLFFLRDPLAETLATIHNIAFYQDLMSDIRQAIAEQRFESFQREWLGRYRGSGHNADPV